MTTVSRPPRSFGKALGPGLLFAGAAVGVSHLVQSTRAGAVYGVALLVFVLAANLFKYPAFQFGPRYAAATGTSLLEGYRRQGRWALVVYLLLTLGTMLFVSAAVTFTTAGLLKAILPFDVSETVYAAGLLTVCAGLLAVGRYPLLDKVIKVVVVVLTLATVTATVVALPRVDFSGPWLPDSAWLGAMTNVLFVAGIIGWMPSAIDISVWHSLWTLARRRETGHAPTPRQALIDFDIGYIGTTILAVCFVLLGAAVMYDSGQTFPEPAHKFAEQVINLYVANLGEWAAPLIGVAAFGVMFSTTFTVADGFPRALANLAPRFVRPEVAGDDEIETDRTVKRVYWVALALISVGSVLLIAYFLSSLKALVMVATVLSFLTAPMLAVLNHRAMFDRAAVPEAFIPSGRMRAFSVAGIVFNTVVAVAFVVLLTQTL